MRDLRWLMAGAHHDEHQSCHPKALSFVAVVASLLSALASYCTSHQQIQAFRMTFSRTISLFAMAWLSCAVAFSPAILRRLPKSTTLQMSDGGEQMTDKVSAEGISEKVKEAAATYDETPRMNPNRPELPELKGDFDWDAKFGDDDDWIVESVPGKIVLNELELAAQVTALGKLEEKWRKRRIEKEYEESRKVGWTYLAETYNGRLAMFFLVVGLLTEYWTGISLPGQVEEMLRVGGIIGFEG